MIDKSQIEHIANLARLKISEEEAQSYSEQLSKALAHFEKISQVQTEGIEPLVTPTEIEAFWREDEVKKEFTAEEMLENAPSRVGNLFKVPPAI